VEVTTSLFFLILFAARLASVTAVPGRREALTFALEALEAARSGAGGAGEEALLGGAGGGGGGGPPMSSSEEEEWEEANTLIGAAGGVAPLSGAQLAGVLVGAARAGAQLRRRDGHAQLSPASAVLHALRCLHALLDRFPQLGAVAAEGDACGALDAEGTRFEDRDSEQGVGPDLVDGERERIEQGAGDDVDAFLVG
jgi:hypothetical protein